MESVYDSKNLKRFLLEISNIFDAVRIVDPSTTNVMIFDDGGQLVVSDEKCYQIWNKSQRCVNCTSFRALDPQNKYSISKLENKDSNIYRVSSKLIKYKNNNNIIQIVILEILSIIKDEMIIKDIDIYKNNSIIYEDSLTKSFNRRFYDEKVYLYYQLDKKINDLAFIMMDMRKFKEINDNYGHLKGDEMLIAFVAAVKKVLSDKNLLIRIGGDEFLIVVRDKADCLEVIKDINKSVNKIYVDKNKDLFLVVDCGYSQVRKDKISDNDIIMGITEADEMMYFNKNNK